MTADPQLAETVAKALCRAHCGPACECGCDTSKAWALLLPDARAAIEVVSAHYEARLRAAERALEAATVPFSVALAFGQAVGKWAEGGFGPDITDPFRQHLNMEVVDDPS